MIRVAVLLSATFLAGCVATPKQTTVERSAPISLRSWERLQTALQDAPVELRQAIVQEAEAQLRQSAQTELPKATDSLEPREVLVDILTHSRNQDLLATTEFEGLRDVVSGEKRQLQHSYAEALAGYLTQADFGCQQPLYAHYFEHRFASKQGLQRCQAKVPFSVLSQYDGPQIVWLDPKRVKAIHLLFASKSASMASRFGHVALRLVLCPKDTSSSAACDANLAEHLVLGFRAHIDELSLNTLKALNGEYRAYLFANRFMDVYQEYAIGEFREIYSLPLRLDDGQRESMVRELADVHWRYAGKYSFFTRNCATMMQNALREMWQELATTDKMTSDYLRPDSLFEAIKSTHLADAEKLASLEVAEREGYYFSSTRQFYDRALHEIRSAMTKPSFIDLESYLQIEPINRRQDRTDDLPFSARLAADPHLREAQIMLEEYAILRSERLLLIEGAKYLEEQDFLAQADSIRTQLDAEHSRIFEDCLLAPIRQHARPALRLNGIPGEADIPRVSAQASICQSAQSKKLLHEAIAWIKHTKSEQWQRVNEISQYLAESLTNLYSLKEIQGKQQVP